MATRHATPGRGDHRNAGRRNHAWILWTIAIATYVALMLGAIALCDASSF